MSEQNNAIHSLAHTKWNCKYHVVFAPKYRRKVFFNEKREDMREILRTLCQWKGVEIIEGGNLPGSCTSAHKYPAQNERFGVYGIFKGEKQLNDISEIWEYEVRIPKPRILL